MRSSVAAILLLLALSLAVVARSLELSTPAAGVVAMQGTVRVTEPGGQTRPCRPEEVLKKGWRLETGPESSADLLLWDKSLIRISQSTSITLIDLTETENGNFVRKIQVAAGRIWVDAQKSPSGQDTFEVQGPQAVAAVKGTAFVVDVQSGGTDVQVFEGSVQCTATDGVSALVATDYEFTAPAQGKARRQRFSRQQLLARDAWLKRNWQSRAELIAFLKTHPAARRRTIDFLKVDPAFRAWMVQHFRNHPARFKASPRPAPVNRPGRPR